MTEQGLADLWLAFLLLLGAVIGFVLGRYSAARSFRHEVSEFAASETLGGMLTPAEKQDFASAYKDSESAARKMEEFAYAVQNVVTPFLGSGPRPGKSYNAAVNAMQFRDTREVSMPKLSSTYRIFLTGGSTAFGAAAPSQDTIISAYLEKALNHEKAGSLGVRYEVFTFASPAWASTQERIAIENRLSELAPDMVISLSGNNDVHWSIAGRDVLWFRTYSDQHFWQLLNRALRLAGASPMPDVTEQLGVVPPNVVADRLEKNVLLSAAALAHREARYVFALQPTISLTTKPLSPREEQIRSALEPAVVAQFRECYGAIKSRLRRLGEDKILFLDLSDTLAHLTAGDEVFLDSYHFGDRGNELLAQSIARGIYPLLNRERGDQNSV